MGEKKLKQIKSKLAFYECLLSTDSVDEENDKPSKARLRAERADLRINVSELPLHLNVTKSEQIVASNIVSWKEQPDSVPVYVLNSLLLWTDEGENNFELEN